MFRNLMHELFSPFSSFGDRCEAAFKVLLMLVVVAAFGGIVFIVVNSVGITPTKTMITEVESKRIIPAYTTTVFMMTGKIMLPVVTHHPESYCLHFKIDNRELESTVKKEFFKNLSVGDKIEVYYGFKRLSDSYVPMKIKPVHDK